MIELGVLLLLGVVLLCAAFWALIYSAAGIVQVVGWLSPRGRAERELLRSHRPDFRETIDK